MALDQVANFIRGTANGSVTNSETTIDVTDASVFPDPSGGNEYNVVIWDVDNFPRPDQDPDVEILRVTARDTTANTLTVNRGEESTTGASHPDGSAIHLSPTAKMFTDIETELANAGNHSVSDDGTEVSSNPSDVNFSTNVSVTDDGDGTVTVNASGGLQDGENFDGQGTSDFTNLNSVDADTGTIDSLDGTDLQYDSGEITASLKDIPGVPDATTTGPGFDTWTQVSSTRPAMVEVTGVAQTDGTTDGEIRVEVDESGGTVSDYYFFLARAHNSEGAGVFTYGTVTALLPVGAQYQIENISDPNNANFLQYKREWTL